MQTICIRFIYMFKYLDRPVPTPIAERLLAAIVEIADTYANLIDRRRAVMLALADIIQADAGVWAWGRGWPEETNVAPVALLDFGVDDPQRRILTEWGLEPETDRTLRKPMRANMGSDRAVTAIRQDVFTEPQWQAMPSMRRHLQAGGWSSWMHSVRYSHRDTWSCFFLLRGEGNPEFSVQDAAVSHLVLTSVPWLHSTAEETLPPESFIGLTPRQRTVMLLLLDGLARKAIASRLDISEDTVGDHIKSIYAHFSVSSASELAAHFLRGR